jgi:type I restriction enzyme, S subunit
MTKVTDLLTDNLDTWTSAIERRSTAGRGRSKKFSLYGIEKLRTLILNLAVRGKLVPQDATDEPASKLVKHFRLQRADRIASKKMRDGKSIPSLKPEELQQFLPPNWCWIRLNDLGDWGAGATPNRKKSSYYGGTTPWFKSGELDSDFIDTAEETVSDLALKECSLRLNRPGDVLIAMYGATIGKTSILKVKATTNQAVCACTPFAGMYNRYLHLSLKAMREFFVSQGWGGAQPNISREKIVTTPFPLPPLAEQHRIVAKVDELMALCDQLEAGAYDAIAAHQLLVTNLLATLTSSKNSADFAESWKRIETHFDTLFTTEDSINQLKQTILQLAVMGKLVPQNPNDEPASDLLKRIEAKKHEAIAKGSVKKTKQISKIDEFEKRFSLPTGWQWCRLNDAIDVRDGTHDSPNDATDSETYPLVTSKDFKNGEIDFENARRISAEDHFEIAKRSLVERDDILFSMIGGNLGNQVMVKSDEPFSIKNVALFKYYDRSLTVPKFIKIYLENLALDLQASASGGAQPFVALGFLRNLVIAIPPTSEQEKIVDRVDELMQNCEKLKQVVGKMHQQRKTLADALVSQAVA